MIAFAPICLLTFTVAFADGPTFELRDGDRVVFVGGTLIERDQAYGYLETMLTAFWPDRNITFRNLGWSGDTVWGEARARFGSPADGFQHLKEHIDSIKPTVIIMSYGANESFAGASGVAEFEKGLKLLLDMFTASAAPDVRIVMIAPLWQQSPGAPLPDASRHNADIERYRESIRSIAAQRRYLYIEVLQELREITGSDSGRLTNNGVHLTPSGYWEFANDTIAGLQLKWNPWLIELAKDGTMKRADAVTVSGFVKVRSGARFDAVTDRLPRTIRPIEKLSPNAELADRGGQFGVLAGLSPGRYSIRVDGQPAGTNQSPGTLRLEFGTDQIERLRAAIIDKNRLYFHRWRPQNETYLFGFRKHEQGQNAAEVPKFDPLIEQYEQQIAQLRVPEKHTYEVMRTGD